MKTNAILSARNLSIGYKKKSGDVVIAQQINLELQPGKLISLLGANGSGKSTLLRTLTGIQPAIDGSVFLNGADIASLSARQKATLLSLVLTDDLPPSDLSVFELVALGRQPYTNWIGTLSDSDTSPIESAMESVGISYLANRKYYELSSGQLQKVLIARALAQDTPLLILDEPSTHLDFLHRAELYRLLKKLAHDYHKCILFSTHELDMALQLSDEFLLLTDRKLVHGGIDQLIENGSFDTLFPSGSVRFDRENRRFYFGW
ncbi:ABC transporter ATP-binding protein [Flavobacterium silvaticum]|uniref:ABC transporter ATP-binding protein n=1 Tax=Flavobacterium silvaticum TaxID=1852020 RepID=A0A972FLA3_9FLAO|nr:ABC transporter ATP-binding protein [Flavobacterium silvaticum]NMH28134.1 ABC transporter ATP-binding protein [Flavobacterium silvaticum]